jgi:hypothetical protein
LAIAALSAESIAESSPEKHAPGKEEKKEQTAEKEEKLANLIEKNYEKKKGKQLRRIVRLVADSYKDTPLLLKPYFSHENPKLAGIATSAFYLITGNIEPIQTTEYGGLGAIIDKTGAGLRFWENQLHFAKLSGNSLRNSENSGDALKYSENSGNVLEHSESLAMSAA